MVILGFIITKGCVLLVALLFKLDTFLFVYRIFWEKGLIQLGNRFIIRLQNIGIVSMENDCTSGSAEEPPKATVISSFPLWQLTRWMFLNSVKEV